MYRLQTWHNLPRWISYLVLLFVTILVTHQFWIPTTFKITANNDRFNHQAIAKDYIVYGKLSNKRALGLHRTVHQNITIRLPSTHTNTIFSMRAWLDNTADQQELNINDRRYILHNIDVTVPRTYHIFISESVITSASITTNNWDLKYYIFSHASITPTTIGAVNLTTITFFTLVYFNLIVYFSLFLPKNNYRATIYMVCVHAITFLGIWQMSEMYSLHVFSLSHYFTLPLLILTVFNIFVLISSSNLVQFFYLTLSSNTLQLSSHSRKYWDIYVVILIHIALYLTAVFSQDVISRANNNYGWDGQQYMILTNQYITGEIPSHREPFVLRIGIPWFVATFFSTQPLLGWQIITTLTSICCTVLFYAIIYEYVSKPALRIIATFLFLAHWLGPLRYSWYHPVTLDSPLVAITLASIWFVIQYRNTTNILWIIAFTVVNYIGVFIRELPIIHFGMLFLMNPQILYHPIQYLKQTKHQKQLLLYSALTAGAVLIYMSIKQLVNVEQEYSVAFMISKQILNSDTYIKMLHAWFQTNGLLILFIIFAFSATFQFFRNNLFLLFYLLSIIVLSVISGTDKERFLMWIYPIVLIIVANVVQANLNRFITLWSLIVIYIQLITTRIFWSTPDPGKRFNIIDTTFFTYLGDNIRFQELWITVNRHTYHRELLLSQYLVMFAVLVIVYWINQRHATKQAASNDTISHTL